MIHDDNRKPKSPDPEELARLLEIELIQKRAAWNQAAARHRAIRMASFAFLFFIIVAALFVYFFVFSDLSGNRPAPNPTPAGATP
jgi:hypothetical protein